MPRPIILQDITIPLDAYTARYLANICCLRRINQLPSNERTIVCSALRRGLRQMASELDFDMRQAKRAIQTFKKTKAVTL